MSFGYGIVKNKSSKGDYSEELVNQFFYNQGWNIYTPTGNKAHLLDAIAMRNRNNKLEIFYYDVKSKAARNISPSTGVDFRHFELYRNIMLFTGMKFYIFFVDEELGKIYYQDLSYYQPKKDDTTLYHLYIDCDEDRYPKIEHNKYNDEKYIYWSLETMKLLRNLKPEEIKKLKDYSGTTNKNYKFNPTWDSKNYLNKK